MSCQPIGLFDSGVGGLSVFLELERQLPAENLIYFADTLHMPYGPRSPEQLRQFVFAILRFLQDQNVKLVIMACNTSSAIVLPFAKEVFSLPMLGMIEPVVQQLAPSPVKRLGVMATEATVQSGTYSRELQKAGFQGEVYCQACPELAGLIEMGEENARLTSVLYEYSKPLRQAQVEQVILGCTHYPFASKALGAVLGNDISLVDPATHVVAEAKRLLERERLLRTEWTAAQHMAYVSGSLAAFEHRADQLLGHPLDARPVGFKAEQAVYHLLS